MLWQVVFQPPAQGAIVLASVPAGVADAQRAGAEGDDAGEAEVKPRLLDLFCGAGGCAMGYHRAGFDVVGVDIKPQKNYPFDFIQGDALEVLREMLRERASVLSREGHLYDIGGFDAIHASPPCQAYSRATAWRGKRSNHPDLIGETRRLLVDAGRPYVIENVQEARRRMLAPLMLCGTMFGLRIQRHRYFEIPSLPLILLPDCQHRKGDYCFDHGGKQPESVYRDAMGCDWMTVHEARQAIPPPFTEWIGRQLLRCVQ